ncbi:MAG: 2Fe-2S iron-sulfur cluster-binding protein, partial [Kiloniellales bacterium]
MSEGTEAIAFTVNGRGVRVAAPPVSRLADVLRDALGLLGTKIGCNAGDCGACTVLLDGRQVCACMVPLGQAAGRAVTTVEGLAGDSGLSRLQAAFHAHGAAQCGICTPGMLMAAADLLGRSDGRRLSEAEVADALAGVLCRCTGYRKIIEAVLAAANGGRAATEANPAPGTAVGARLPKVDGVQKLDGTEVYAADWAPADALWLRVVRSPHAHARFGFGDMAELHRRHPGLVRVLTWADVPGNNGFGVYPQIKDQPVLAKDYVRYRGEAVAALVGERATVEGIADGDVPIDWAPLAPITDM